MLLETLWEKRFFPRLVRESEADAEKAHELALHLMGRPFVPTALYLLGRSWLRHVAKPVEIGGVIFPWRVGFPAGLVKNAEPRVLDALSSIFGFGTVGTVTPRPQVGNERPRLFRLMEDRALVNRLGFNSLGAEAVARNLEDAGELSIPIGVSLGKMGTTPNRDAAADYIEVFVKLRPYADFFEINVSSPNTKGLRDLQEVNALDDLVKRITDTEKGIVGCTKTRRRPFFVKIAPDVTFGQLDDILDVCRKHSIIGITPSNTTTRRDTLRSPLANETGGASGPLLFRRTCELVGYIKKNAPEFKIKAVGGISSPDDAARVIDLGADLVELYTALVYQGPALAIKIAHHLATRQV